MTELPDLTAVSDHRGASEQRFDDIFIGHYGRLVRVLTLVTGDQSRAEDAVQEAFHRAYARWRRVGRYDAPEAWIRKVALNRARDLARAESRRRRREERVSVPDSVHDPEPDPDVTRALSRLPDRQRAAIALHYLEGLSVRDTAASMGISEGAVKFHLHQGRKALAPLLGEEST